MIFTMRTPYKLKLWLTLFTLTLVAMFGVNVVSGTQSVLPATSQAKTRPPLIPYQAPTTQPVCPPTCSHLQAASFNLGGAFIVKLATPFQDESQLTPPQIAEQRTRLLKLANEFDVELRKSGSSRSAVVAFYYKSPYMVADIGEVDLPRIVVSPLVERIYVNTPFEEYADLNLGNVEIDLQSLATYPIPAFERSEKKCGRVYLGDNRSANSCQDLVDTAKKYGYAYVGVLPILQYGTALTPPQLGWAYGAHILSKTYKIINKYKNDIFNRELISVSAYGTMSSMYISVEGLQKMIDDPEIDRISAGWDEIEYYERKVSRVISDNIDMGMNVTLTPTATIVPTFRAPGTNLKHLNSPSNNLPDLTGKEIILIDDGVLQDHIAFNSNRVLRGQCFSPSNPNDPNFRACYDPNNPDTPAVTSNDARPCYPVSRYPIKIPETCGHGSLQAGIIASSDTVFTGISKSISIYPIRIASQGDLLAALYAALEYARSNTSKVLAISMSVSWGNPKELHETGYCDQFNNDNIQLNDRIGQLKSQGILTFIASGNDNTVGKVHSPACFKNAISVGAVDPYDPALPTTPEKVWVNPTTTPGADVNGSNTYPYLSLYAPGYGWGASVDQSKVWQEFSTTTSQAAPQAAAVWALYRVRHPDVQIDKLVQDFLASPSTIPGVTTAYLGKIVRDTRSTATPAPTMTPKPTSCNLLGCDPTSTPHFPWPTSVPLREYVPRVDLSKVGQPKVWIPNVNYDYVPSTGASVTPPLSCDYLAAGQDCTLREAVAAALPQDVIGFSEEQLYRATLFIEANPILIDKPVTIDGDT
jgi:hypothetical protein